MKIKTLKKKTRENLHVDSSEKGKKKEKKRKKNERKVSRQ
jgi:hypothetical protein